MRVPTRPNPLSSTVLETSPPSAQTTEGVISSAPSGVPPFQPWQPPPGSRPAPVLGERPESKDGPTEVRPAILRLEDPARGYGHQTAYSLCHLADLAYYGSADQKAQLGSWGFDSYHALEGQQRRADLLGIDRLVRDTQGFVAGRSDAIVVGFRGTQLRELADLITDAEADPVPHSGGLAHRGFLEAYQLVSESMRQAVAAEWARDREAGRPLRPVFLAGHSLGAALATLAAEDLEESIRKNPSSSGRIGGAYLFAAPAVATAEFVRHYDQELGLASKTYRHVNNNDRIARVSNLTRTRLSHVAQDTERYITTDGRVLVGTTDETPQRAADMEAGRRADLQRFPRFDGNLRNGFTDGLRDHPISRYLEVLGRLAGESEHVR